MDADITFDFERALEQQQPVEPGAAAGQASQGGRQEPKPRNYRQTVCTYWLRGLCMKGDTCGFLHQFDPQRMPVCRNLLKYGVCKEPDCPYKHTTEEIKECNMYKLGFCIYGPACRFKHTRQSGPPPDPEYLEAAKPKEFRNINIVANQANEGILPSEVGRKPLKLGPDDEGLAALPGPTGGELVPGGEWGGSAASTMPGASHGSIQPPSFVDKSLLAAVGQRDLRYGF